VPGQQREQQQDRHDHLGGFLDERDEHHRQGAEPAQRVVLQGAGDHDADDAAEEGRDHERRRRHLPVAGAGLREGQEGQRYDGRAEQQQRRDEVGVLGPYQGAQHDDVEDQPDDQHAQPRPPPREITHAAILAYRPARAPGTASLTSRETADVTAAGAHVEVINLLICLGDATATVRQWADATVAEVSGPAGMTMLGSPASADGFFFTVRVDGLTGSGTTVTLGLRGARPSSVPTLLGRTWAGAVWIGTDLAAYAVDLSSGRVTESILESPFREFFVSRKLRLLAVVYESGMRCFNSDGSERWRADTDLIEDLRWTEETVTVEQLGRPAVVISLADGTGFLTE
jgi:hypothetical protein